MTGTSCLTQTLEAFLHAAQTKDETRSRLVVFYLTKRCEFCLQTRHACSVYDERRPQHSD